MDELTPRPTVSADEIKYLVQKGYDRIALTYMEWSRGKPSARVDYIEKLFHHLGDMSQANILELGCGAGVPCSEILAKRCARVVANDISQAQIDLAKANVPKANVEFIAADMASISFEPSSFQAVVAFYSIIHLPRDEQRATIAKIWTWLSPGGYLVCNLGTSDNTGGTGKWLGGCEMYWSSFAYKKYLQILKDIGFRVIESVILQDDEDGRLVPFLWIITSKDEVL